MGFGSLSPESRIRVILEVIGGPAFKAQMNEAAAAQARLGKAGAEANLVARRGSFLYNQFAFTARRYLFYTTLAVSGLTVALFKLGLQYNSIRQTSIVAMQGFMKNSQAIRREFDYLYKTAAFSPFRFQDIMLSFRRILPFAGGVRQANSAVLSLLDSLSAVGLTSESNLNRATIAMQHMFAMGRVTGLSILQFSRDNIPMLQALAKYYGVTTMQMTAMVKTGLIPAATAAKALSQYTLTQPGFAGKREAIALGTLHGVWTTFKDILAQSMAGTTQGMFGFAYKTLRNIDKALEPMFIANKPITLYNVAQAINKSLTPNTNAIINLFTLFTTAIKTLIFTFWLLFKTIQIVIWPFDKLASIFGINIAVMKLMGVALAYLIIEFTIMKVRLIAATLAEEGFWLAEKVATAISWLYIAALWALNFVQYQVAEGAIFSRLMEWLWTAALYAGYAAVGLYRVALFFLMDQYMALTPAIQAATDAAWGFTAAILVNPLTWIIVAVVALIAGLVILYFKWKAFRDAVNAAFNWIVHGSGTIHDAFMYAFAPLFAAVEALKFMGSHGVSASPHWQQKHGFGWNIIHRPFAFPGLATGGTVMSGGLAMVGERGPELVRLPSGAKVTPLSGAGGLNGGSPLSITVMPQAIYFDRRQVGQVMAEVVTDQEARQ